MIERVLIVDDEPLARERLAERCEQSEHMVHAGRYRPPMLLSSLTGPSVRREGPAVIRL